MEWTDLFKNIKNKDYCLELNKFLNIEYKNHTIYPPRNRVFACFDYCSVNDLKVVIVGQDPYHEENQANGLAFSVNKSVEIPPSLINIYKEIKIEFGNINKKDGDLTYLAKQGVLLLNKYLTVRAHMALSHKIKQYDNFFIDVINFIEQLDKPIVYMLWGREAQKLEPLIKNKNHLVLKTSHPSPLSANKGGWFNSNVFIKCNNFLKQHNLKEIDWGNMNQK